MQTCLRECLSVYRPECSSRMKERGAARLRVSVLSRCLAAPGHISMQPSLSPHLYVMAAALQKGQVSPRLISPRRGGEGCGGSQRNETLTLVLANPSPPLSSPIASTALRSLTYTHTQSTHKHKHTPFIPTNLNR